jgi:hypothetical protein
MPKFKKMTLRVMQHNMYCMHYVLIIDGRPL